MVHSIEIGGAALEVPPGSSESHESDIILGYLILSYKYICYDTISHG